MNCSRRARSASPLARTSARNSSFATTSSTAFVIFLIPCPQSPSVDQRSPDIVATAQLPRNKSTRPERGIYSRKNLFFCSTTTAAHRLRPTGSLPYRLEDFLGVAGLLGGAAEEAFGDEGAKDAAGGGLIHAHVMDDFGFGDAPAAFVDEFERFFKRELVAMVEKKDSKQNQHGPREDRTGAFQRFLGQFAHHIQEHEHARQHEHEADDLEQFAASVEDAVVEVRGHKRGQ